MLCWYAGINRQVKYGMSRDETFSIDSDSGIIKLMKPVDREAIAQYLVNIYAYDQVCLILIK